MADKSHKVLIVVDMQNDFINGALGTKEAEAIVPNVVKRIEECKAEGCTIIVTMDTHTEDYMDTMEGKHLPVPHCIKNTKGWSLHPDIENALRGYKPKYCVYKHSFGTTKFANLKNIVNVDDMEIELIGLCTDICVVSNALRLKAFFPENELSVRASCCAGVTPALHQAALDTMRSCQINIL